MGKLSAVRVIPRVLKSSALKAVSLVQRAASSSEVQLIRSKTASVLRAVPPASLRVFRRTESIAVSGTRSVAKFARSNEVQLVRSKTMSVVHTLPPKSLQILRRTRTVVNSATRSGAKFVVKVVSDIHFASLLRQSYSRLNLFAVKVRSIQRISTPRLKLPSKSIVQSPISELQHPNKILPKISFKFGKALNDFSNLPLWLTLPMLFTSSFVLGGIISYLMH